jgi:predicted Zn-dependent protease
MQVRRSWLRAIALCVPLLLAAGCSINPATGRKQLNFYAQAREIRIGEEAAGGIVRKVGLYDDPALQAYVEGIGRRLAAVSERPELPWSFKVLDDAAVNAFALPGGHVYVTRGILAYLGSEAELATVMGHEIGHVTARHGVNQLSKQMLAAAGLALLVSRNAEELAGVSAVGLGLISLKHSRDDERQADRLGLRYAQRAGYDARASLAVFSLLGQAATVTKAGRLPSWLSTHPAADARRQRLAAQLADLERSGTRFEGTRVERDGYLSRLEGMVFGDQAQPGRLGLSRLTDARSPPAPPPRRMRVRRLAEAMTLEEFARAYPSTVSLETVALLNHVEPGGRLEARRLAKQVVGGLPAWGGLRSEASPPGPE